MAKKIYHLPLQKVKEFKKRSRGVQTKFYATFGKLHYTLEIEKFLYSLQLQKDELNALKTTQMFQSKNFTQEIATLLELKSQDEELLYAFFYELHLKERELFKLFLAKLFLHFYTGYTKTTNIQIDYINIAKELAKLKKVQLKDSFGEREKKSFFKIFLSEKLTIDLEGNSIKTLRKKAYRKLTHILLDFQEDRSVEDVYDKLHDMKMM